MPELTQDTETKAAISYIVKLSWDANDIITVYNMSNGMSVCGSLTATGSGSSVTFSGELQAGISSSDKLLLEFHKGLSLTKNGSSLIADFSSQNSTTSTSTVPFITTSTISLTASQLNSGSVELTPSFNLPFVFCELSMAGLPSSAEISEIELYGLASSMVLEFDGSSLSRTSQYDEKITVTPASKVTTMATGARSFYITFPESVYDSSRERDVFVSVKEGDSVVKYHDVLASAKLSANNHYRTIVPHFEKVLSDVELSFSAPFTYNFYGDEDTYDFPENFDLYENGHQGWKRGDELSVVNLTTGELLQGTLWSEANGGITDFSGTVYGDKGLNEGDKLLLLYPAVGNESAMDFKTTPIIYDVNAEQDGTLGNVPLIMAAKATYTSGSVSFSQEYPFEHLTSIIQLSATLDPDYIEIEGGDIEVDGDGEDETEEGDNEGFYEEDGAWSEEDYFGETSLDFTPTGMEVLHVPTKLMISYAGDEDYKLATINDGTDLISVSNDCGVTVEDSKASPFYISVPAAVGDAWGSYTSIAASYYSPDGIKYLTYDYQWNLRMQTFYEIDIPLPYDMADDMDGAEEGDENTNI